MYAIRSYYDKLRRQQEVPPEGMEPFFAGNNHRRLQGRLQGLWNTGLPYDKANGEKKLRVIVKYSKSNEAIYVSHLDVQRSMQRTLRRSGLPVKYTLGFHPHIAQYTHTNIEVL